jgi:hypothetical protein
MGIVIWYEILNAINLVSKQLQEKDMLIDIAIEKVKGLLSFFSKYKESGFTNALESAKEITLKMGIEPTFPLGVILKGKGILMRPLKMHALLHNL